MGTARDRLLRVIGLSLPGPTRHLHWLAVIEGDDADLSFAHGTSQNPAQVAISTPQAHVLFEKLRLDLICRGYELDDPALSSPGKQWLPPGESARHDTTVTLAPYTRPVVLGSDEFRERLADRRHMVVPRRFGGEPALLQLTSREAVLYHTEAISPSLLSAAKLQLSVLDDAPRAVLELRIFGNQTYLINDVLGYDGADARTLPFVDRYSLLRQIGSELTAAGLPPRSWSTLSAEGHSLPTGPELDGTLGSWSDLALVEKLAVYGKPHLISDINVI